MRRIIFATLIVACAIGPGKAADRNRPAATTGEVRTGKERLSDKASDEQRVDDCKVPPARRTRARPDELLLGRRKLTPPLSHHVAGSLGMQPPLPVVSQFENIKNDTL
jgi:hypothetical protein